MELQLALLLLVYMLLSCNWHWKRFQFCTWMWTWLSGEGYGLGQVRTEVCFLHSQGYLFWEHSYMLSMSSPCSSLCRHGDEQMRSSPSQVHVINDRLNVDFPRDGLTPWGNKPGWSSLQSPPSPEFQCCLDGVLG